MMIGANSTKACSFDLKDVHLKSPGVISQNGYLKVGKICDIKYSTLDNGSWFQKIVVSLNWA